MTKKLLLPIIALAMLPLAAHAQQPPYTPDANTILLWNFDQGSGNTILDVSGNGYNSNTGEPTVPGQFGGAYDMSNGVVQFGNHYSSPIVDSSFTFEAGIEAPSGGFQAGQQTLVGMYEFNPPYDHNFYFGLDSGKVTVGFYSDGSYLSAESLNAVSVTDNWTNIAVTYDVTTSTVAFYEDGTSLGVGSTDLTGTPGGEGYLYLGKSGNGGDSFTGLVDNVKLSDVVESVPEPSTIALTMLGFCAVALWGSKRSRLHL